MNSLPDFLTTFAHPGPRRQSGAILFISLILLVILTVLGVVGLRMSVMQERMGGNQRDREIAFEAAESALRAAEKAIGDQALTLVYNDDLASNSPGSNAGYIQQLCEPGDPKRWTQSTAVCQQCTPGATVSGYECPAAACWLCSGYNWNVHSRSAVATGLGSQLRFMSGQNLPSNPRYVIEELKTRVKCSDSEDLDPVSGKSCVLPVRRVTAIGRGVAGGGSDQDSAVVILQNTYFPTR